MAERLKILIIDDSIIFRNAIASALSGENDIEVTGTAHNGARGIELIKLKPPDLVTCDVEMPVMDGLATLKAIQEYNAAHPDLPDIGVIMVSSVTTKGAEVTINALEYGAFDFVTKPDGKNSQENTAYLRRQLLVKIRLFALRRSAAAQRKKAQASGLAAQLPPPPPRATPASVPAGQIKAVIIGVSTGGPRALSAIMPELSNTVDLPIFIVQHMPPTFTQSLAESLNNKCRHQVIEGRHNDIVDNGWAYIAPGGRHMLVRKNTLGQVMTTINDQPPENGCRPSVDVLFRSAAAAYGGDVVAIILTGMGNDGTKSLGPLKRAGAYVIAQDEATSVVWGMPGSAVASGQVDDVLPLDKIPTAVGRLTGKR
ncbi:MAG: chemotaxis response regulator protein-glutamate methylesterase [Deltaproteobacteria bacterium]|nr:chemotaxis response regulator protein-glutamate methylesterase [Deltaproteobacteria bacterium]